MPFLSYIAVLATSVPITGRVPLLAAALQQAFLPLLASGCVGGGVFLLAWQFLRDERAGTALQDLEWRYDVNRMAELRRISLTYRAFEPVIHFLAAFNRDRFRAALPEIDRQIQAAGLSRYWTGEEYLARLQIVACLLTPAYFYVCFKVLGVAGLVLAPVLTILTVHLLRRRLANNAVARLNRIKRRLPYLLDLLTLLMEAGSTFLAALEEGVNEFRTHAVGEEFGRVLGEIALGKSRIAALEAMRDRLDDDEITSIVGSIIQGETLGTPLARLFRTQADILRVKRTQRAETIAGEAGVKMLLPAILVMASTCIVILGPFVVGFIYNEFM